MDIVTRRYRPLPLREAVVDIQRMYRGARERGIWAQRQNERRRERRGIAAVVRLQCIIRGIRTRRKHATRVDVARERARSAWLLVMRRRAEEIAKNTRQERVLRALTKTWVMEVTSWLYPMVVFEAAREVKEDRVLMGAINELVLFPVADEIVKMVVLESWYEGARVHRSNMMRAAGQTSFIAPQRPSFVGLRPSFSTSVREGRTSRGSMHLRSSTQGGAGSEVEEAVAAALADLNKRSREQRNSCAEDELRRGIKSEDPVTRALSVMYTPKQPEVIAHWAAVLRREGHVCFKVRPPRSSVKISDLFHIITD